MGASTQAARRTGAALAVTALVASGLGACGASPAKVASSRHTAPSSPTPASPTSTSAPTPSFVKRAVRAGDTPSEVVTAYGSVWVVGHRAGDITRIDPATGAVQHSLRSTGSQLIGIAASGGHIWYLDSSDQRLEAVNATTNTIDLKVPVGSDGGGGIVAAPDGGVWFAGTSGAVEHLDRTGRVTATVKVEPKGGLSPWLEGSTLYLADPDHHHLFVVDTRTRQVIASTRLAGDPGIVATGPHRTAWVGNFSGPLRQVDRTGAVLRTVAVAAVDHLVTCRGRLWVRVSDTSVVGIDQQSGAVVKRYAGLPTSEIPGGGLTCAGDSLWEVNWTDGTVWQIPLG